MIATVSKKLKNTLFCYNQKQLYQQLDAPRDVDLQVEPDVEGIKQFWTNLWANSVPHNYHSDWLATLRCLFSETVHDQEDFTVTTTLVSQTVKKFANWKAPGADEIHAVWLKHLSSLHQRIASQLQRALEDGPPGWMTVGRTVLVMKGSNSI